MTVDDDKDALRLLGKILASQGHEVVTAGNGREALEVLHQSSVDVIISDIMMPEMDGFELCRQMKLDARLNTIPFIFHTATYVEKRDERLVKELGACSFLIKPVEPDVLAKAIKACTASPMVPAVPADDQEYQIKVIAEHRDVLARKLEKRVKQLELERTLPFKCELKVLTFGMVIENKGERHL